MTCHQSEAHDTYIDLHLSVESIVEQQVVGHADSVRLHGMPLTVVIVSNIACNIKTHETYLTNYIDVKLHKQL